MKRAKQKLIARAKKGETRYPPEQTFARKKNGSASQVPN